jgi:hypothetical protein
MQNKALSPIKNFSMCTSVRDLHTAFNPPYVYDYITKLCRQLAEVIENHENEHIRSIGQGLARHRKYKWLKLEGDQTVQMTKLPLQHKIRKTDVICSAEPGMTEDLCVL